MVAPNKIDSNFVNLAIAEELNLRKLPDNPKWYAKLPNSFSDIGPDVTDAERAPITASRQRRKGRVVDLDASAGYNTDLTENGLIRDLQGFFFADAREKATTKPLNRDPIVIDGVTAQTISAASGLNIFAKNDLVALKGFAKAGNNRVALATAAGDTSIAVDSMLTPETPTESAFVVRCGIQLPSGDASLSANEFSATLTTAETDLSELGLIPGEWVFIGGDEDAQAFANVDPGYARIHSVGTNEIVFDDSTFVPVSDNGSNKTIRIFFGHVLKNEKEVSLIKRRSYQAEIQMGNDGDGQQAMYITGCVPNQLTINYPETDKLTADLAYVSLDTEYRSGSEGLKSGQRIDDDLFEAYNSTNDLYRVRVNIVDPANMNNASLFGFVSEATLEINNNVSVDKALGVLGGFDTSVGDFEVSGSITAYFSTIEAVRAIRNSADVAFNVITAYKNAGFIIDVPLLGLSGGQPNIEKDSPVTLPIDISAGENEHGFTAMAVFFEYLPNVAMPD